MYANTISDYDVISKCDEMLLYLHKKHVL